MVHVRNWYISSHNMRKQCFIFNMKKSKESANEKPIPKENNENFFKAKLNDTQADDEKWTKSLSFHELHRLSISCLILGENKELFQTSKIFTHLLHSSVLNYK